MKKILIIVLISSIAVSASASGVTHGRWYRGRSHVIVSAGVYAPLYSPFYGYNYPFYPYYPVRPTKLELKIDGIKNDYKDKIWSARHDKSMSRPERRKEVHQLKHDRTKDVNEAISNYHKSTK